MEDLWRDTLGRAWWAVWALNKVRWGADQFSSCPDPARNLQDGLESWVGNLVVESWGMCLRLAGSTDSTKNRELQRNCLMAELQTRVVAVLGVIVPSNGSWVHESQRPQVDLASPGVLGRAVKHKLYHVLNSWVRKNYDWGWRWILTANVMNFCVGKAVPNVTCLLCRMPGSCDMPIPLILKE